MPSILFVCTANRYRSPIAEACFKAILSENKLDQEWDISSAGTWTEDGLPPMPDAIQKSDELGLDIQAHRSRVVTADILQPADLIIVMDEGQQEALWNEFPQKKERIVLFSKVTQGIIFDIPDPVADPSVGNVADEICKLIRKNYQKIIERGKSE